MTTSETPPINESRPRWVRRLLPWIVWGVLLGGWTFALVRPVPQNVSAVVPSALRFWTAKGLHLSAYAFLAFVGCWLPGRWRMRVLAWTLLLVHGAVTEFAQNFVGREGQWSDVGLDAVGILVGIGAGRGVRRWFGS